MTLFSITDTSDYLNELLSGETSGTVHSVYRKTINLSIGGTLAALQAKGSPISANQSDYNIDFRKNGES